MARVLVVEDEADIRDLVRLNLELGGHEVLLASGGAEGLELAVGERPDCILLDVMMPVVDGWDVLAELKASSDPAVAEIPVIVLTARRQDLDRVRGGIEGAIRYLTKPFSPDALLAEVEAALTGDPEPAKRKRVQAESLEQFARIERGVSPTTTEPPPARPHLTRLERRPSPPVAIPISPAIDPEAVAALSDKQRELLAAVGSTATVTEAAAQLAVSRSNVYASLRRVARRLNVRSVPELVTHARAGAIDLG